MNLIKGRMRLFCVSNIIVSFACTGFLGPRYYNDSLEVGQKREGKVTKLMPYGAFVDIGDGLSGLVHISQISHERIKHPGVVLKEGQEVNVKVIDIKDGKISLSIKALLDNPEEVPSDEEIELPESEGLGTSLGDLLDGLKL